MAHQERPADVGARRGFLPRVSRLRVVFLAVLAAVVLVDALAPVRRYLLVALLVVLAGSFVLSRLRR